MATIFLPTRPRALPAGAVPVTHQGRPAIRYRRRGGKVVLAFLTENGTKCLVPSETWHARYTDANGHAVVEPLSENKTAAQRMLGDILKRVAEERAGVRTPQTVAARQPLADRLAEYRRHLSDAEAVPRHADQAVRRCQVVFDGCHFFRLADVDAGPVERWLADRRALPRAGGGFGPQTSNHYVTSLKAFGNWLVATDRVPANPFRRLTKLNVETDTRHIRRPPTDEELTRLIAAAEVGSPYRKMAAADRAQLYFVAVMTGLRAAELDSLTPASFDMTAATPTVTVEARRSKRKKKDKLPLHPDLARRIAPWLAEKGRDAPLWPGKWAKQFTAAAMLKRDLAAARAVWIDEATTGEDRARREASDFLAYEDAGGGKADFHSLRHRFITSMVKAGVLPKDAMQLARHSTITLTMDRYAHVTFDEMALAVARIPALASSSGVLSGVLPAEERVATDRTGEAVKPQTRTPAEVTASLAFPGIEDFRGGSGSGEGGIRSAVCRKSSPCWR